jgi:hypothetical protein
VKFIVIIKTYTKFHSQSFCEGWGEDNNQNG